MKLIDPGDIILSIIIILLVVFVLAGLYSLYLDEQICHRRGGAFVKGFMSYECVVPR